MRIPAVILALAFCLYPSLASAQWHRAGGPHDAPPPPRDEGAHSRSGYVWTGGHYGWRHRRYEWSGGRYERERRGREWHGGSWERHEDHYDWHPGGWRR